MLDSLLRQRRMVREYLDRPVEREKLQAVLEAALRGPSAGNSQGISLLVLQDETRRQQVAALAREGEWLARGYPRWLSAAPVHVVLCVEPDVYRARYGEADKSSSPAWTVPFWHVDGGCALMLLLLAAVEQGLGAGFQGIQNLPGLRELLLLPSTVEPLGIVTLGYALPGAGPRGSQTRPRRTGRIHWESW